VTDIITVESHPDIPGAQVLAYEKMNKAAETIIKVPHFFSVASPPTPAPAKTNSQMDCQIPPMIRGHRRENRPMTQIPKNCSREGCEWWNTA
jgi:hypothetical protein